MTTLTNQIHLDVTFLTQQDKWNELELKKIAANVHDNRRRHADETTNYTHGTESNNDEDSNSTDESLTDTSIITSSLDHPSDFHH